MKGEIVMIYAKLNNPEEKEILERELKSARDKNWYRRLQIIKLSAFRHTVQELSDEFSLCHQTIRNYINAYNQGGIKSLFPGKSSGRPPKISNWTKQDWDKVLEQTPNQYEKLNTQSRQWTLERLRVYVKEYHNIDVSKVSIHRSLGKTGRRTGRSKLRVGSPDPDYVVKRETIKELRDFPLWDN
jgi:transposase